MTIKELEKLVVAAHERSLRFAGELSGSDNPDTIRAHAQAQTSATAYANVLSAIHNNTLYLKIAGEVR